jgi:hypothetical protein
MYICVNNVQGSCESIKTEYKLINYCQNCGKVERLGEGMYTKWRLKVDRYRRNVYKKISNTRKCGCPSW